MGEADLTSDPLLANVPVHEGYKVLGGVAIYQKLGQGGMGAVYRGRHVRLEFDVALKVMVPSPGVSPKHADAFVKRFLREARTAARIQHPNLIRVTDVNTERGVYYLVMDFVEGESAAGRLKRKGPLPEAEAAEICLGAAEGLAEAHKRGIVHRDIKPDNIMIDKEGRVKVADLGLAKAFSGDDDDDPSMLTQTQQAMGTPSYMAPEQFESARSVGPPADVWSLGVTLYQLLTGKLPWEDSSIFTLADKIRREPLPDARQLKSELSGGVCQILDKALRKNPAERYTGCGPIIDVLREHLASVAKAQTALPDPDAGTQSATSVHVSPPPAESLIVIASQLDVTPVPEAPEPLAQEPSPRVAAPPVSRSALPWAIVAILLLAGGGAAWYFLAGPGASRRTSEVAREPGERTSLTPRPLWVEEALARLRSLEEDTSPRPRPLRPLASTTVDPAKTRPAPAKSKRDYAVAIREFDKAIELGPTWAYAYYLRGLAKSKSGDYAGGMRDYDKAIELKPNDADAYYSRGVAKGDKGDHAGAIQDYDKTIELKPDYADAYHNRGVAKSKAGDYADAIRDFDKAIELKPNDAVAYYLRGLAKSNAGDYADAIRDFDKAIELKPNDADAYYLRGQAKGDKGDYAGAIRDYDKVIELKPDYAGAYYFRGAAKSNAGDYAGEIRDYDKAIELKPNDADVYHSRGLAKSMTGDYAGAIRDYDKAIELKPDDAGAYYFRGLAKGSKGDNDGAKLDNDNARRLGYTGK